MFMELKYIDKIKVIIKLQHIDKINIIIDLSNNNDE